MALVSHFGAGLKESVRSLYLRRLYFFSHPTLHLPVRITKDGLHHFAQTQLCLHTLETYSYCFSLPSVTYLTALSNTVLLVSFRSGAGHSSIQGTERVLDWLIASECCPVLTRFMLLFTGADC